MGLHNIRDGSIDPHAIMMAYASKARRLGVEFAEGVRATGLRVEGGRVTGVHTTAGPVAERLANAKRALSEQGVELLQVRRSYDDRTWPHATRGYFRLKSRIPEVLEQLGLGSTAKQSRRASG